MDEEFVSVDEVVEQKPKRKYSRRNGNGKPGKNGFSAPANATAKRGAITLSEAQFRKLFKLLTGGDLAVSVTEDAIEFHVPADAIQIVVPALLEKL